jgi:hypothetical protein
MGLLYLLLIKQIIIMIGINKNFIFVWIIIFHLHNIFNLDFIFLADLVHIIARLLTVLGSVYLSCVLILLCIWKDVHI